ncbi:MAG: hypothetical protein ACOCPZ_00265 [Natrialbaceae archaeon]
MSESEQSGAGQREVAYRIFAAEFDDADYSYSESDEERAPNYVVTPTGARANRLFLVGVLTEVEEVSEDVLRARVVDPTGAFVLYAGQYQPDEQAFLEGTEPPTFVAVTGKARTFSPDDSDQVFTSIRPESISEVDAETRDRWTVQAAEQTIDRIRWAATALTLDGSVREELISRGVDEGLAHGIELALSHYGTTAAYLESVYEMAVDAARVVAGEKGEIEGHTTVPDASGDVTAADLLAKLPDEAVRGAAGEATGESPAPETGTEPGADSTPQADTAADATVEESEPVASEPESDETEPEADEHTAEPQAEDEAAPVDGAETADRTDSGTEDGDELGDFESDEGIGDFEPDEEFELEAEKREEIESEYGTEFKSGTEVEEPGNADIETPEPEETEPAAEGVEESSPAEEDEPAETAGDASETAGEEGGEPSADESKASRDAADEAGAADSGEGEALTDPDAVQEAVVELMGELDDGDGADRERLLSEMESRHGTDPDTTEEAIQSALMDGKCYEPDDSTLKPI